MGLATCSPMDRPQCCSPMGPTWLSVPNASECPLVSQAQSCCLWSGMRARGQGGQNGHSRGLGERGTWGLKRTLLACPSAPRLQLLACSAPGGYLEPLPGCLEFPFGLPCRRIFYHSEVQKAESFGWKEVPSSLALKRNVLHFFTQYMQQRLLEVRGRGPEYGSAEEDSCGSHTELCGCFCGPGLRPLLSLPLLPGWPSADWPPQTSRRPASPAFCKI